MKTKIQFIFKKCKKVLPHVFFFIMLGLKLKATASDLEYLNHLNIPGYHPEIIKDLEARNALNQDPTATYLIRKSTNEQHKDCLVLVLKDSSENKLICPDHSPFKKSGPLNEQFVRTRMEEVKKVLPLGKPLPGLFDFNIRGYHPEIHNHHEAVKAFKDHDEIADYMVRRSETIPGCLVVDFSSGTNPFQMICPEKEKILTAEYVENILETKFPDKKAFTRLPALTTIAGFKKEAFSSQDASRLLKDQKPFIGVYLIRRSRNRDLRKAGGRQEDCYYLSFQGIKDQQSLCPTSLKITDRDQIEEEIQTQLNEKIMSTSRLYPGIKFSPLGHQQDFYIQNGQKYELNSPCNNQPMSFLPEGLKNFNNANNNLKKK